MQQRFIELTKQFEEQKEAIKKTKEEMTALMMTMNVGDHFQDHEDGTVFQIVKPTGTYVSFDSVGYERTKREGEAKGSMSKKKAEELGYTV